MRSASCTTLCLAASAVLLLAACGGKRLDLRLYDPTGAVKTQITAADVVRSSAQVGSGPTPGVYFGLTRAGAAKFRVLTRALARRGARLHRFQHFVFELDGRVYGRPYIDYRAYPDGMSGGPGLQITTPTVAAAQRLAAEIRRG